MTPKVLGLIASPRRLGNCELMVKAVGRAAPVPCDLTLLRLQDFEIRPCTGCYACLFGDERCVIDDDLQTVHDAVLAADALIVAAPTYFLGANGMLKRYLDRGISLLAHIDRLWGRPAVGIGIAGIPGREGSTPADLYRFLKLILADVKAVRTVYGALPGEVFEDEANRQVAADLAEALLGDGSPASENGPRCPVCGGDAVRFLDADRVRCLTCGNSGTISMTPDGPALGITDEGHRIFTSREAAIAHRAWLQGMKDRFRDRRADLKAIRSDFRHDGTWVRPFRPTAPETP